MTTLALEIQKRIEYLQKLKKNILLTIKRYPEGKIRVSVSSNSPQYYLITDDPSSPAYGKYIRKKDQALARKLCQKEYDTLLLKAINFELAQLEQIQKMEEEPLPEKVINSLPSRKQLLISPRCVPFDDYASQWLKEAYDQKTINSEDTRLVTSEGVKMRSKSELLIASRLEHFHIPYKYEKTLFLSGIQLHPDFTILHPRSGKECYWEHLGMMDNADYVSDALRRIELYHNNGFFLGDRLFISFETGMSTLNLSMLDSMLKFYFL